MPFASAVPPSAAAGSEASAPTAFPGQPALAQAWSLPRAGFWERIAAGFLDVILLGLLSAFLHRPLILIASLMGAPPASLLVTLAYFAGMWTWKGTTVGGIILGLRVVRLDGQPITFAVALVRALAGAFSVAVLFLGFLWSAWDPDKQGWHDKIAGTVVVRMPRGTPLV